MNIGISRIYGKILRTLRKKKEISQESLAENSGLHINTVYLLERGKNEPKISTFLFIAKALDLDAGEFLNTVLKEYYESGKKKT